MSDEIKPRIPVGPPVWVESLMTAAEYREYCKEYPSVCNPPLYKVADFNKHSRWRHGMGSSPTAEEIAKSEETIESLRKFVLEQQNLKKDDGDSNKTPEKSE
jgi:hypothetical protein